MICTAQVVVQKILKFGKIYRKGRGRKMYSALKSLKSLSFSRKLQVIRMFTVIQSIILSLLLYFVHSFVGIFYLEVYVGLSWMIVFSLVAAELVLDLRLSSEVE